MAIQVARANLHRLGYRTPAQRNLPAATPVMTLTQAVSVPNHDALAALLASTFPVSAETLLRIASAEAHTTYECTVRTVPKNQRLALYATALGAAKRGSRFEALEPIRQGIRERFGGIGAGVARGLRLRHDHGSNYLADDFQQEIAFFGIESSPSFVREPEGNGVAERFIRTLKENLLWVRSFETIEELRLALLEFKRTYNEQWMLEKYDYRSPARVRRDLGGLDAAA